ncbi:uncharacterized protein LOC103518577 isoform X1 [Diaphorina citri]|uniref:Uncharacterized protein LOC103518577 isoform X1 n=1 Tax=Diaphorina citri TaxID=121845 RepID=A0A3Q0JHC4_DIACI|nr:uncharacterized protein LOC103518577 isoform X1 [Diaphorina citri]XP_026686137.1 uncharacterized protein LOC103518577 isoform X1 [Diaphorina citri]
MGPKPKGKAPAVKDFLTDPNFTGQIEDALTHTKFIQDQLKITKQNVTNFRHLKNQRGFDMKEKIDLLSHSIQNDLREKLKDLEETTKTVRNTFGIADPTAFDTVELNKLDVEMCSIKPLL